jgi:hypothetical protein
MPATNRPPAAIPEMAVVIKDFDGIHSQPVLPVVELLVIPPLADIVVHGVEVDGVELAYVVEKALTSL